MTKKKLSNFRPVILLNRSSRIYENILKDRLILRVESLFTPNISAYRKCYTIQRFTKIAGGMEKKSR